MDKQTKENVITQSKVKPDDIFEISKRNPIVNSCVTYWRQGYLTWEEMLEMCVVALVQQNEQLTKQVKIETQRNPMPRFTGKDITHS